MLKNIKDNILKLDEHTLEVINKSLSSFIVRILGMIIGLIVSIFLARSIGAEGLGVISLASRIIAIIMIIGLLGIPQVIIKEVSIGKVKENWKHIGDVMHTSYLLCGIVTITISILFIFLAPWISVSIFNEERLTYPLVVSFLVITPQVFSMLFSSGLIGFRKIWQSNLVDQTLSVAIVGLLLFLLHLSKVEITINLVAILYAIGRVLVTISIGLYWKKIFYQKIKATFIGKTILKTSMPLMVVSASYIISTSIDSLMVGWLSTTKQVGFFSIALKLALLTGFLTQISKSVLSPKIAQLYHSGRIKELHQMVKKMTKALTIIGAVFLVIIIIFGNTILTIWGEEFTEAYWILVILSIGQFFNTAAGPVGILLVMTNEEKILKNITLIALCINIVMNYFFITEYGGIGAAIATAATVMLNMILCSIYVKRKLKFTPFFYIEH